MKLFQCQNCGQPLYFETKQCDSCGYSLGYLPARQTVTALEADKELWRALADSKAGGSAKDGSAPRYRYCANVDYDACNWLIPSDSPDKFCPACRHNRMIPDLSQAQNLRNWRKIETAKHRLFYTLLKLKLPLTTRPEHPNGLAFDFLASPPSGTEEPVMTGHEHGLITINLAEADDAERERIRGAMHEPYRTLLGHFRHEVAHYFWDHLILDTPSIDEFREVFGDERVDYGAALQAHYANGPPPDWQERFVTAYASTHPWEDFAETWAHYFHMVETLETAGAFGMRMRPKLTMGADLDASMDFDPHLATMDRIIDAWLPLTFAVNSINRSMGIADLYPFVLAPPAIVKLAFVHERIKAAGGYRATEGERGALRAVIAGLKRAVGLPEAPQEAEKTSDKPVDQPTTITQ
jgi:hypothetical protein